MYLEVDKEHHIIIFWIKMPTEMVNWGFREVTKQQTPQQPTSVKWSSERMKPKSYKWLFLEDKMRSLIF